MRLAIAFGALACIAAAGCPASGPHTSTGSSGSGSTGGSGSTSSGTSGTGTTGGTSSGGSTTGGFGPGAACGDELAWFGDVCAAKDCTKVALLVTCGLGDGGFGQCDGQNCATTSSLYDARNCGAVGLECPFEYYCYNGRCANPANNGFVDCASARCFVNQCVQFVGCVSATCNGAAWATACLLDAGNNLGSFYPPMGACCDSSCLDLTTDHDNCGNCGLACDAGELCVARACVQAEVCGVSNNGHACALPSGDTGACCFGSCADLKSDSANCGSCGWGCLVDAGCSTGSCGYVASECPAGTAPNERGTCSPESCGANSLGTPCAPDGGAYYHSCCSSGCTDIHNDPQNCGGCGVICKPGTACIYGSCQTVVDCTSSEGQCALDGGTTAGTCCEGLCVDPQSDPLNCSRCGVACPLGSFCFGRCTTDYINAAICDGGDCPGTMACALGECLSSQCGPLSDTVECARDGGLSATSGLCCAGACLDLESDPDNCGRCGRRCQPATSCISGVCQYDGGASGDCPPGTACAYPGSPCSTGCLPLSCAGLDPATPCSFGPYEYYLFSSGACCGGACADLTFDPANCGGCGISCPSGICRYGTCVDPDPPAGCSQSCAPYTRCANGECVGSTCNGGTQNLACFAADGTVGVCCYPLACGYLADDPLNCGACGIACPQGQSCTHGTCSGSPGCGPGKMGGYCDLDAGLEFVCCPGWGCVNTSNDILNCGSCLSACADGGSCVKGVCK